MKLISYPNDNSSAMADNIFRFEEVDQSLPQEVEYHLAEGELLGVKRYVGKTTIDSSPKCYITRSLDPQPLNASRMTIVRQPGREVSLYASWADGAEVSPTLRFLTSREPMTPPTAYGASQQWRVIEKGRSDEIALLLSSGGNVMLRARMADGTLIKLISVVVSQGGVWVINFVVDDLLERVGTDDIPEGFDLDVLFAQIPLLTIHYRLERPSVSDVRLAWLADDGAIHLHTFALKGSEELHTRRSESNVAEGSKTLALEAWSQLTVVSRPMAEEEFESVAGVVTSPRVWRIDSDGAKLQQVVAHKLLTAGRPKARVELTLKEAATTRYL